MGSNAQKGACLKSYVSVWKWRPVMAILLVKRRPSSFSLQPRPFFAGLVLPLHPPLCLINKLDELDHLSEEQACCLPVAVVVEVQSTPQRPLSSRQEFQKWLHQLNERCCPCYTCLAKDFSERRGM